MRWAGRGQGIKELRHPHRLWSPGPPPPTRAPQPTRGGHAGAGRAGRVLQAEAGVREEAGETAAGAVVGGGARPRLLLALPADDVAVTAALQVVPELRVVARRARAAHGRTIPAARPLHEGARGALAARQPLLRLCVPPRVRGRACRHSARRQRQQQGGQRPRWGPGWWARPWRRAHGVPGAKQLRLRPHTHTPSPPYMDRLATPPGEDRRPAGATVGPDFTASPPPMAPAGPEPGQKCPVKALPRAMGSSRPSAQAWQLGCKWGPGLLSGVTTAAGMEAEPFAQCTQGTHTFDRVGFRGDPADTPNPSFLAPLNPTHYLAHTAHSSPTRASSFIKAGSLTTHSPPRKSPTGGSRGFSLLPSSGVLDSAVKPLGLYP